MIPKPTSVCSPHLEVAFRQLALKNKKKLITITLKLSYQEELEQQKSQEREFGVFYDDDYNYLQHLKDANPAVVWSEPTSSSTQQPQVPVNVQVPPQVCH